MTHSLIQAFVRTGLAILLVLLSNVRAGATPTVPTFDVSRYGARSDGRADSTAALQAAIDAAAAAGGGVVFIPPGTYAVGGIIRSPISGYLNNCFLELRSNVSIVGMGRNSVIRVEDGVQSKTSDAQTGSVLQGVGVHHVTIRDLLFDMNGPHNLTPVGHIRNGHAIRLMNGGQEVRIVGVTVLNNPGHNDIAANGAGRGLHISGCHLISGGHYVSGPENVHNADFSFIYSEWTETLIEDNVIEQGDPDVALRGYTGGLEIHGNDSRAERNRIRGCDPAVYIASQPRAATGIVVAHNLLEDCANGISLWLERPLRTVSIHDNVITLYAPARSVSRTLVGILQPHGGAATFTAATANGALTEDLAITNNTITTHLPTRWLKVTQGIALHSVLNGRIARNNIEGMTSMGIALTGSPWGSTNLTIEENTIVDCGRGPTTPTAERAAIYISVAGASTTPPLPFLIRNVVIRNNVLGNSPAGESGTPTGWTAAPCVFGSCPGPQLAGIVIDGPMAEKVSREIHVTGNSFQRMPYGLLYRGKPVSHQNTSMEPPSAGGR
jgi:hypothetical protein